MSKQPKRGDFKTKEGYTTARDIYYGELMNDVAFKKSSEKARLETITENHNKAFNQMSTVFGLVAGEGLLAAGAKGFNLKKKAPSIIDKVLKQSKKVIPYTDNAIAIGNAYITQDNNNMKKKTTRVKYSTGTAVKNYLTNPSEVLAQHQINIAQAQSEAMSNPFTNALEGVGGLAMKYGIDSAGGLGGLAQGFKEGFSKKALGGKVGNVPVEVEGGEVGETPNGELLEFEGPNHSKGGIDVDLPGGTEIYSKIIQKDGKSMADRKKIRERREQRINKLFEKSPGDRNLKKTLERTQKNNALQEQGDTQIQDMITELMSRGKDKGTRPEFGDGGTIPPPDYAADIAEFDLQEWLDNATSDAKWLKKDKFTKGLLKDQAKGYVDTGVDPSMDRSIDRPSESGFLSATGGDLIGMIGNLTSTFGPMKNTKEQRGSDTPNINAFADYGREGMAELDKTRGFIGQAKASRDMEIDSAELAQQKDVRNTARGVNSMRDLSLATYQGAQKQKQASQDTYATAMANYIATKAGALNEQDKVVQAGEAQRDIADREDKDAYYSQLAQDIATKGTGLQKMGKDINATKTAKVMENLINQLSLYGLKLDKNGKLVGKDV